jgi:tight adherence protein C
MTEWLLLGGFFLFVMTSVTLAGYFFGGVRAESSDGESLLDQPDVPEQYALYARALRRVGEAIPGAADPAVTRGLLVAAGYRFPSAVSIYNGVRYASALLFGAIGLLVAALNSGEAFAAIVALACGAGFGFVLPEFSLKRMVAERRKRIRQAIPSAIDLLVLSIESGQSLAQSIVDASSELRLAHPDLSSEFAQVHLELRAGKSRADALRALGMRNGDPELRKLSGLLVDSERFGTSLGPALRTHAKYLRIRMRQSAQERARKVTVKLIFPVFFLIFPSVLLVTLGPAVLHMMRGFAQFIK